MKLAVLSFYTGHISRGVETWTSEIASRLAKKGHDVLVLQGAAQKDGVSYKIKVISVKILWKLRGGESWISQVLSYPYWFSINLEFSIRALIPLYKFKPDVVIPCNGEVQTLLVKIYCLISGCKMVVVGHAGIGAPDKWNLLMRPDVFVSPSKRGEKWAKDLFIAKGINVVHIPHGIDLNRFSPRIEKVRINLQRPIILCVSSFDPFKRVDLAVKAVSKLEKGSLLVIGGDREEGRIDNLADELLGEKRYSKIRVLPNKIPSYYASSDLFTLPSSPFEAFGLVYLEALASNLAVVATDDELRREIVDGAGILVNPTNTSAYAKALSKALKTKWGDKPRKQASNYSWTKVIKMYESLFEKLIYKS